MWCHQWPSRHHHQHPLVLVPPPFFLSLEPTPLSFPLPLLVVVVRWMERQVRASPTTHHHCALWLVPRFSAVCVVCCVVAWWAWLVVVLVATPRLFRCHQCLCFQSFTTHPPRFTTQSQSLSSSCPCAHSFCHSHSHTAKPHHHATHTHTRGGWCTLVPGVCVPTVLAVAAPGSPLTRPPTPCAPHHTTPPLAAAAGGGCGGGSVGVVACVATWSTHWLCWCCPLPIHTHTHTG